MIKEVNSVELDKAANDILESRCQDSLNYERVQYNEDSIELNDSLVNYVLNNTTRRDDGRLVMPLTWRNEVSHYLGTNRNLATKILQSKLNKLRKN